METTSPPYAWETESTAMSNFRTQSFNKCAPCSCTRSEHSELSNHCPFPEIVPWLPAGSRLVILPPDELRPHHAGEASVPIQRSCWRLPPKLHSRLVPGE